jgi:hypothetical protein
MVFDRFGHCCGGLAGAHDDGASARPHWQVRRHATRRGDRADSGVEQPQQKAARIALHANLNL